jgi:hypothetical protein
MHLNVKKCKFYQKLIALNKTIAIKHLTKQENRLINLLFLSHDNYNRSRWIYW